MPETATAHCVNCRQPIEKVGDEWHPYSALALGCAPAPCVPGGPKPLVWKRIKIESERIKIESDMAARTAPPRQFHNGQRVTVITAAGARPGTITDAMVSGVRHPGWVYTIRVDGGPDQLFAPTGLITEQETQA